MTTTSPLTISEQLFEEFCIGNAIPFTKIREKAYPTPDYKIEIGGSIIFVEIKQFDKNEEDKLFSAIKKDKSRWESTDKRIRHAIEDARKQFKNFKNENNPNLLVVYDNTKLGIVDPVDVKTAMYGDETVDMEFCIDRGKRNLFSYGVRLGGNKKMTPIMNTSISAVSILEKHGDNSLFLYIFHNAHAKYPINPSLLRNNQIAHFIITPKKSDGFQEWQTI